MTAPLEHAAAAGILTAGGVLILGTDTLPGFHCRADATDGVRRIQALKGRAATKPLLLLAGSLEQALTVAGPLDAHQAALCDRCWPGPFSLILPARPLVHPLVTAQGATVAVRVPDLEALRSLVRDAGCPLVSTSVNREGTPPSVTLPEAVAAFGDDVDGWWDPLAEEGADVDHHRQSASALVDLMVWPPRVIRAGPRPLPGGLSGLS